MSPSSIGGLRRRIGFVGTAMVLALSGSARHGLADAGGGWPAFRGANSDGVSTETGIFGDGAVRLEVVWRRPLGSGYSGVSVAGGRAVTMFSDGEYDNVIAFDCTDGRELWRYPIDTTYRGHDGSQDGPIPTPVLVVEIGAKDAMALSFDPKSGKRLWAAGDDTVNYQSPIHYWHAGRGQVLAAGDKKIVCIEPESGKVLWEYAHEGAGSAVAPFVGQIAKLFLRGP
jgi:outer membrane protein assembly factor BamB